MPSEAGFGELQRYTNGRPLELPRSARELLSDLRVMLVQAANARKLGTPVRKIHEYVRIVPPPPSLEKLREQGLHRGVACIVGGAKNQDRDVRLPHLARDDGSWFDFSIVVREAGRALELLAYDFEIRCAPSTGTSFLRFDLNLPDHRNEDRDLRCHLHPGSDDILVPAPLLSPAELLTLFLDGIRFPADRKRRAPTDFDVGWLRQSLAHAESTP